VKKLFVSFCIILGLVGITYAGELEEAKLKMQNIQLEFSFMQQRQQVLQYEAKDLQQKIKKLEAEETAEVTKDSTVPNKVKKLQ